MLRHALVIGGVADVLIPARRLGIETLLFQRKEAMNAELGHLADHYHLVAFDDHDATVQAAVDAYREKPFDCVVSFSELGMIPAAIIAERLGLPGASRVATARLLRDKLAMRGKLNTAGLSPVRTERVESLDQARDFAAAAGYPLIIKPRSGTGSMGVRRAEGPAELAEAVAAALAEDSGDYLIEEFLAGREFSVEAFSFSGIHRIVAVTGKQVTANYVESGHIVPADVSAAERAAIRNLVTRFLDLAGITDGPSHTEVIIGPGGPRIVESHDRLGGDKIFRLVELAYGVNLVSWCYEWPLRMMTVPRPATLTGAGCIRYILPPPGRVESISIPDSVRHDPQLDHYEIEASVGEPVRPVSSSLDRAGFVVATGADAAGATEAAERLAAGITIDTLPVQR